MGSSLAHNLRVAHAVGLAIAGDWFWLNPLGGSPAGFDGGLRTGLCDGGVGAVDFQGRPRKA